MHYLQKLLWDKEHRSASIVSGIGLALGFLILLLGLQSIIDIRNYSSDDGNTLLTINKKVNLLNTMGVKSGFLPEEIKTISEMSGVEKAAAFVSNTFKLRARSNLLGFYSEFFLESLPDGFLSDLPEDFVWDQGSNRVPIIIPREYIALYNFGFAPSQGLPQVSPELIRKFSFDLEVFGTNMQSKFSGNIIGLSDQANTILVPHSFLTWANNKYGSEKESAASRLAVLCEPAQQAMLKLALEDEGYEINSNQLLDSKASLLIQLAFWILVLIGLVIFLLAGYLAMQSLKAMISNSSASIKRMFETGQRPEGIINFYHKYSNRVLIFGITSGVLSFVVIHFLIKKWLNSQGLILSYSPNWFLYLFTIACAFLFYLHQRKRLQAQLKSYFP